MSIRGGSDPDSINRTIFQTAATDNAAGGYCAKGVGNILEKLKLPHTRGHAYTWKDTLPQNGWIKIDATPETAPPGAVLVYDRNHPVGAEGGARYGHIEIKAEKNGICKFASDKARDNFGGTVPQNFVGAYVHPDLMAAYQEQELLNPSIDDEIDKAIETVNAKTPEKLKTQEQSKQQSIAAKKERTAVQDNSVTAAFNETQPSDSFNFEDNPLLAWLNDIIEEIFGSGVFDMFNFGSDNVQVADTPSSGPGDQNPKV